MIKTVLDKITVGILVLSVIACSLSRSHSAQDKTTAIDLHVDTQLNYPDSPLGQISDEVRQNEEHYVVVLDKGDEALLAITHLLRLAQQRILIQTFIWSSDESGNFITQELVKAAQRGVDIKIIIDALTLSKDPHLIAALTTMHPGIEVKFYNPVSASIAPSKLALLRQAIFDFKGLNQRMHNKVMVVDDFFAILGGRNYQNDYFDRGDKRNFKDRDVLLIGKEVKKITGSFSRYWEHPLSVASEYMTGAKTLGEKNKQPDMLSARTNEIFADLETCLAERDCLQRRLGEAMRKVSSLTFVADSPGKPLRIGKYKTSETAAALYDFLETAEESILMQTPYLVARGKSNTFFKKLRHANPDMEIKVSSNSLASADHIHAYAFAYKNKEKYLKNYRWQIYELRPLPADRDAIISVVNKEQRRKNYFICIHAKTYVVDRDKVWIGSYNIDPRSANLNTEVALIIEDYLVAQAVRSDIERDMADQNSWTIAKRKQLPLVSHFSGLISTAMRVLPLIDIWPFAYSGSYQLKPGKEALSCYDPGFYENYEYLGPFPAVALSEKEIKARLIKAFFGAVEPLI